MTKPLIRTPSPLAVAQKITLARGFSGVMPVYVVNEFPKSGSTWVKTMTAMALDLPVWTRSEPIYGPCVMQAHWITPTGLKRVIGLWRDGRDVMVSFYHHCLFYNELSNKAIVDATRAKIGFEDYENVRENLPRFIEFIYETPVSPRFTWTEFVDVWWDRPGVAQVKYEDLRADTPGTLQKLVHDLVGKELSDDRAAEIAEACSMKNMKDRMGEGERRQTDISETSFIRKGSVGGWRENFSDEAAEVFEKYAGDALRKLGYT